MKPIIQKLPLTERTSFVARTYRTPQFEVGWHQHVEHELILFTEGSGMAFVGNHIGYFETGDIYLLGSNLPHTFQKTAPNLVASAVVVQFCDDFWGSGFLNIPESQSIKLLLQHAAQGLKMGKRSMDKLRNKIIELENALSFRRVLLLGECLQMICECEDFKSVSSQSIKQFNYKEKERIDQVFQYTIDHFKEHITLHEIAAVACMTVPAFCNYFKRSTQKTYIDFLNEIKIGYACSLLQDTNHPIAEICYTSGFNTPTHFHQQFIRQKGTTPLQFRKNMTRKTQVT